MCAACFERENVSDEDLEAAAEFFDRMEAEHHE
jgi:hypothetical protein